MNRIEAAYLAGLIDGEGTVSITKQKQYKRKLFALRPWLIVSNTNAPLILFLKRNYGGSIHRQKQRGNSKPELRWQVLEQKEIKNILVRVFPYLRIKKVRAKLLLRFLISREKRKPYSKRELAIFEKIKYLNRRGIKAG